MNTQKRMEENPSLLGSFHPSVTNGRIPHFLGPLDFRFDDQCGWLDDTPSPLSNCGVFIIADITGQVTENQPISVLLRKSSNIMKVINEELPIDETDQHIVDSIVNRQLSDAKRKPFPK